MPGAHTRQPDWRVWPLVYARVKELRMEHGCTVATLKTPSDIMLRYIFPIM